MNGHIQIYEMQSFDIFFCYDFSQGVYLKFLSGSVLTLLRFVTLPFLL